MTITASQEQNYINKALDLLAEFPVIIQCPACNTGNVITSPGCIACGTPLGQVAEDKIKKHSNKKYNNQFRGFSEQEYSLSGSSMVYRPDLFTAASSAFISQSPFSEDDPWKSYLHEDDTPVYEKCSNCWTLNDIRKYDRCQTCGQLTGEI